MNMKLHKLLTFGQNCGA